MSCVFWVRNVDVLILNNNRVVVIEINDDGEVVIDTTIKSTKELKMLLDMGCPIQDICQLEYTEILKSGKELIEFLKFLGGLEEK